MSSITRDRNFGCRINDEMTFRGLRVIIMENDLLRIGILLDKGTSIYEFLYKPQDVDFMFVSSLGIRNPNLGLSTNVHSSGFLHDYWEGGWQEMFPNGGSPSNYKGAEFGQHGEVHLIPWSYQIVEDTPERIEIKFWVRTYRTPFLLEKNLSMERGKPFLDLKEKVTNESEVEMDFMWGHHPVIGKPFLDEACVVDLPARDGVVHPLDYSPDNFLAPGQDFRWPLARDKNGLLVDLSQIASEVTHKEAVVYLTDLDDGWCAVTNTQKRLGFGLVWDKEVFPYIWYWQEFGGGPGYPWYRRHYNIGLEPWSSIPSLGLAEAIKRGTQLRLTGGESLPFHLRAVVFQGLSGVTYISREGIVEGKS